MNSIMKDPKAVEIRFAMCFPDVMEIGESHLGMKILYDMFNRREDVWCERVYSPWMDLDQILRENQIPLFALESQDPVRGFDFLGITLQYEMCYTNVLQILDLSGIPLMARERTWGGSRCHRRPVPVPTIPSLWQTFLTFFILVKERHLTMLFFDLYKSCRQENGSRREFLKRAAAVPGIYVPSMYQAAYYEDGRLASFQPIEEGIPQKVQKQVASDLENTPYPKAPVMPFIKATQDRVVLEIQRGCIRGCRFCQAGMIYRPTRERNLERLKQYAREMLKNTGHEEISLSSLSSSDYSDLAGIVNFLIDEFKDQKVNISLPSLRIDAFSLDVMSKVQDVRKSSLTFAPEAGSQRMRDVINKGLTEEDILTGAKQAFRGGWNKVKLYFMLGASLGNGRGSEGDCPSGRPDRGGVLPDPQGREKRQMSDYGKHLFLCPQALYPPSSGPECSHREITWALRKP